MRDVRLKLPSEVKEILTILHLNNFEAYVVGGCVRDSMLGKVPNDWDITTSATPGEVQKVFKNNKIVETGLQHGTVTLVINDECYEITTFRKDGEYSDNRRPDNVEFTKDIIEDLKRRDFTINAMAYNENDGLLDPFGGLEDLERKVIRCVGNPEDRFNEDALRILRALRFSCQLDFTIHASIGWLIGYTSISKNIQNISAERVRCELEKMIVTDNFYKRLIWNNGIFLIIIPELEKCIHFNQNNPYHVYDVLMHTARVLKECETNDKIVKLAALFHDIGKPSCYSEDINGVGHFYGHGEVGVVIANDIMRRLKFDNDTREKVIEIVKYHDATIPLSKSGVKRWLNRIGEEQLKRLLILRKADINGQNPLYAKDRLEKVKLIQILLTEVLEQEECFSLKDLSVNGNDLIQIGFKPGKKIGKVLKRLLDTVIADKCENDKHKLLQLALQMKEDE